MILICLFCFDIVRLLKIYNHMGGLHSYWTVLLSRERVTKQTSLPVNAQEDFPE